MLCKFNGCSDDFLMLFHGQSSALTGRSGYDNAICAALDLVIDNLFELIVIHFHLTCILHRCNNSDTGTFKNRHNGLLS